MPDFDFQTLALVLGTICLGLAGAIFSFSAHGTFPEQAERTKRSWIPTAIKGALLIVGVVSLIMSALGG